LPNAPRWLVPVEANYWGARRTYLVPEQTRATLPKDSDIWRVLAQEIELRRVGDPPRVGQAHTAHPPGLIHVRWPDGIEANVALEWRRYWITVGDMGRNDSVDGYVPWLTIGHHGATFAIELAKANVAVFVMDA
jgi:hypothetical protein